MYSFQLIDNSIMHAFAFGHHKAPIGKAMLDSKKPQKIAALWIKGMIGHGLDAVSKTIRLAPYLIHAVGLSIAAAINLGKNPELNKMAGRSWVLIADSLMTIGIDSIGMVIPYLAYKIDRAFVEHFTMKHFKIPNPYYYDIKTSTDQNAPKNADYKTLGIKKSATLDEVTKARKVLALRYHPDKNSSLEEKEKMKAEEKMKEINLAYGRVSEYLRNGKLNNL